jgi:tripartite ATP-independent transporter DctM subunit
MDPVVIGLIGVIILFFLLTMGVHIGIALGISGFIGILIISGFEQAISMNVTSVYHKISNPSLITLPLFILMGYLASGGGISRNLFDSLSLWLGKIRGGLGIASVIGCTAFGTVCGSSVVTTAVFCKICAPEMRRHGYSKSLAYAICASSGSIGMLIPPSIIAIVYGMLSGVSIGKVLMAGVAPGLVWCLFFSLTIILIGKFRPASIALSLTPATWRQRFASLKLWWPILIVAASIFGGIYGGVFTPSEAAAVASFVLFAVYIMANVLRRKAMDRQKSVRELNFLLMDTATTSALIFLVMGSATVFSNFIVLTGIATKVLSLITSWGLSKLGLVLLFSFIYLILGCFLDSISMLCITIPVFNPIIEAAGIDPIWYATIVIVSVEIGLITPPVGLNLYAAKGVAEPDVTLEDVISGILPFLAAELLSLVVIIAFPRISTFLPGFVG